MIFYKKIVLWLMVLAIGSLGAVEKKQHKKSQEQKEPKSLSKQKTVAKGARSVPIKKAPSASAKKLEVSALVKKSAKPAAPAHRALGKGFAAKVAHKKPVKQQNNNYDRLLHRAKRAAKPVRSARKPLKIVKKPATEALAMKIALEEINQATADLSLFEALRDSE